MSEDHGAPASRSRLALLGRSGVLAVVAARPGSREGDEPEAPDLHVCLTDEGAILAFNGHVDLGTGVQTALAQIVAEELDVAVDAVTIVLGDTADAPNQGPTIASETIQVAAIPLRHAAAQARRELLSLAASALDRPVEALDTADGLVRVRGEPAIAISYARLLGNRRIHLPLDASTPVKPVSEHRVVGRPAPRVDIPAKASGQFVYVHDVRLPGMLHGRVVRPPYSGIDAGEFVGKCLESVDPVSIGHIPGIVAVVTEGDFVGIVAEREEHAAEAAACLSVSWKPWTFGRDLGDLEGALSAQPAQSRRLVDEGDVEAALADAERRLERTYVWPYQMHGSIGPSCAVADVQPDRIRVWSGTQNPFPLRTDLALLTGLPEAAIAVVRLEAAGCYGRNCADDVTADAVLLSRAVGRPVRVQLTREQEHLWEPKGAAQLMQVSGALGPGDSLLAYDFQSRYPSNAAPTLALLLTGRVAPNPAVLQMGDRTARPAYSYDNLRVTIHDMAPIVRAAWLRGVSALPNVFAHESFIDELAAEAGADPVEFRLRHMTDPRAAELARATAERAGWQTKPGPKPADEAEVVHGRGFAQARYVHGSWPGVGAAWSAWVADVAVNRRTGEVAVTRVVVGQDTGLMVNPAGVTHQIHGNVIQSTSRVLKEEVRFSETTAVAAGDWGAYPVLAFPEAPAIDVVLADRQDRPPLGAGESASVPSAAAIVNAVYDATGVRFRELPLTPERVLAGLGRPLSPPTAPEKRRRLPSMAAMAAGLAGLAGFAAVGLPLHPAIDPIARPEPGAYSSATIERGRLLASLGGCIGCHSMPGGIELAGGVELPTPFGTIVSPNITPDVETGIGSWSYPAFERSMRKGIHRDGGQLYPAFPYTSFARVTDEDLQALYAYLMAQPAAARGNEPSRLAFPFNLRPLMAGWNLLFHRPAAPQPQAGQSPEWNRGRYLVDGLGHCGACHTPRNLLGAEKGGRAYLAGGLAKGWDAPALTRLADAPLPWSQDALYAYLRTGTSPDHGSANGPMADVIGELAPLPDADIRAMAVYLASLNDPLPDGRFEERRAALLEASSSARHPQSSRAARLYEGACAVCHEPSAVPLVNRGALLALNTSIHAARPDNLLRVVTGGVADSAHGSMPAFGTVLDDGQIAELARYLRARFAPGRPAWDDLEERIGIVRDDRTFGGR